MLGRTRAFLLAAIAAFFVAPLAGWAQESRTLVVTKSGYYWLTQDAAGVPSLVKIERVIKLDEPPPTDPTDPTLTDRAKAILQAARAVTEPKRAETARMLAVEYRAVVRQVTAGQLVTQPLILLAAREAADRVLSQQQAPEQWKGVRQVITDQWTALVQEGASDGDFAKLLVEVAEGLEASTR